MHFHQAHIGEYRGTTKEPILNKIQLWDTNSLLLKEYTYFKSSSLKERVLRHTNIQKHCCTLVYLIVFVNCYYMLFSSFFNAVFEQSCHNIEQYKLEH